MTAVRWWTIGELEAYLARAQQSRPSEVSSNSLPSDYMLVVARRSTARATIIYDSTLSDQDLPGSLRQFPWYEEHADEKAFTTDAADKRLRWRVIVRQVSDDEFGHEIVHRAQRAQMQPQQYYDQLVRSGAAAAVFGDVRRGKALASVMEQVTMKDSEGNVLSLDDLRTGDDEHAGHNH